MSFGYWGLDDETPDSHPREERIAAVEADVAEDLMRLAMPMRDAYDWMISDGKRIDDNIPEKGTFYHGTDHEHQPGDILTSVRSRYDQDPEANQERMDYYTKSIGAPNHADWVWMYNHPAPATKYMKHVYEVEPLDEGPWIWNNMFQDDGVARPPENDQDFPRLVSPRVRVVRKLSPDEYDAASTHLDDYYKAYHSRTSAVLTEDLTRLAMGWRGDTPQDLTFKHVHNPNGVDYMGQDVLTAHTSNGEEVGQLYWFPSGEISWISVRGDHAGRDIGRAMVDHAVTHHNPNIHHSTELTPSGRRWMEQNPIGQTTAARLAMPAPLPQGIQFKPFDRGDEISQQLGWKHPNVSHQIGPGVAAYLPGNHVPVGHIEWLDDRDADVAEQFGEPPINPGEVSYINVDDPLRRQSIGTALFDHAQAHEPRVHHSQDRTELGKRWVNHEQSRNSVTAAVTQNLVDRLHDEFKDWHRQQPKGSIFGGGMIGGLNEWPNIERFLKDRYPAAHRNLNMGHEQAGLLMDGIHPSGIEGGDPYSTDHNPDASFAPYETGLEAEAKHGYDPKEIAAGMLLLHNKTDRFRGDMSQEDQARLNDIAQKRYQMQRAYEQRGQTTAGLHGDLPENITFQHHSDDSPPFPDVIDPRMTVWAADSGTVSAHDGDQMIGYMRWRTDNHPRRKGEIKEIRVHPDYQRRGVGTAMFDWVTDKIDPDLKHSNNLSDEGRAFADAEDARPLAQERYEAWRNGQPMPKRFAMAWDEWSPQIKHMEPVPGDGYSSSGDLGIYYIDHNTETGGNEDDSQLAYSVLPNHIDVHGIYTNDKFRERGVAESMMRRLHQDYPDHQIRPGNMTDDGQAFHDRMLDKEPDARGVITAGRNGDPPPMTFERFNTMWSNGIMARHAGDGRPIAHLHWHPDGEIETIRVHPELQGRDIAKHVLAHAATHPETYEARQGIKPSNNLTNSGRAFARSLGHNPSDEEVEPADDDVTNWGWTAIDHYTPMHIPYTGQNEDEMSHYLDKPWTPPERTASNHDDSWPAWWRGRTHPNVPWDKRWHPNHPQHVPGPWDN